VVPMAICCMMTLPAAVGQDGSPLSRKCRRSGKMGDANARKKHPCRGYGSVLSDTTRPCSDHTHIVTRNGGMDRAPRTGAGSSRRSTPRITKAASAASTCRYRPRSWH
jgi:hypothetical protein